MDPLGTANAATKRSASDMEPETDNKDGKKYQKIHASGYSSHSPADISSDERLSPPQEQQREGPVRANETELLEIYNIWAPDEKQEITDELELGSHKLVLEHNNNTTAKCRAFRCLVEEQPNQHDERIRSPYRLNLYAAQPPNVHWSQLDKPNRRFYHVSCLEAVGVDIAKYVTLPPELVVRSNWRGSGLNFSYESFHPAIIDWVTTKGKAFDAGLYGDYSRALKAYNDEYRHQLSIHAHICSREKCVCGPPLDRPKSEDFIPGEPSERTLTDVLLHEMGAEHLMPLSPRERIWLVEVFGEVPASLSKEALASEDQGDDGEDTVEGGEGKTDQDGESAETEKRDED